MKFQVIREKETIFKQFQEEKIIYCKGVRSRMASDFSIVTLDASGQ